MKQDDDVDRRGGGGTDMALELRYDAPLATFDGDEWTEFLDEDSDDVDHVGGPGHRHRVLYADSFAAAESRPCAGSDADG